MKGQRDDRINADINKTKPYALYELRDEQNRKRVSQGSNDVRDGHQPKPS